MDHRDLQNYFKNELKPVLERLDAQRKWILGLTLTTMLIVTGLTVTASSLPYQTIVIAIVATIVLIISGLSIYPKYRHKFKAEVVSKVMSLVNQSFKYYPGEGISLDAFIQSGLYEIKPNKLNSNDYTQGKAAGIEFAFATVDARKLRHAMNGPSKNVSVFSGIFLHLKLFHESLNQIYIVPNRSSLMLGNWSQKNRFMGRGYFVKTGHSAFDNIFAVYTYQEDLSGLIVNELLLDTLLGIHHRFGQEISISFLNSGCYFSMTGGRQLFNPRLVNSVVRFEDMLNLHAIIEAIPEIVKLLMNSVQSDNGHDHIE